ncbi:hypothetical protein QVD17_40422 [Tagetes erecta]|uniref:Cell wall hydroxyproline-rich glycoprotein n=1 Tax=Tagetes erecta TaxID=13708 RepID=A0AAD8JVX2_TARER|nr:hypothetical protein QVD17_40422 [Tagetes erecta]
MEKSSNLFTLSLIFLLSVHSGAGAGRRTTGNGSNPSNPNLKNAYIALQAWRSAIKDDPKGILNSWVGSNVCDYKGVFCAESPQSGTIVAGIDLNHGGLEGILVKELSLLKDMSLLHLNSNRFSGTIPDSLKDLFALTELDLSNNLFSGSFPIITLQIPNLVYLDLRYNLFSGPIPDLVFNKNLDAILLNNNNFEGQIPQTLANSPASVINLANNKLTGDIPISFGYSSPGLKEILFLNNQLTGCIPQGIGLWSDLQVFDASFNSLMGHLPDTVSCLEDIEVLNVAHNKLSGELPDLVCELKSLMNLSVAYNFFSGFSQECAKLYGRNVEFDFALNCIPGRQMQRPEPECDMIPGGSLSCLRIPSLKSLSCGALLKSLNSSSP